MSKKKTILIVEDEKPLSKLLCDELTREGFEATVAENGEDAIKILQDKSWDLVLLDIIMPVKDGFHVLQFLNDAKSIVPVFILTNLGHVQDDERASRLGAEKYFVKADTPVSDIVLQVKKRLK